MAKLKVGSGKKGRSPNKKKVVEEITLDSSSDNESDDGEVMEVPNDDDNSPMEVDKPEEKDSADESDVNEIETVDKIESEDRTKPEEMSNGAIVEPAEDDQTKEPVTNGVSSENDNEAQPNPEIKEPAENGEKQPIPPSTDVEMKPPEIKNPLLPELRPGHVWTITECKAIFQHLKPRVALSKLKHSKKYLREMSRKETEEDSALTELLNKVKNLPVMQLANGVSAVIQPNGDTIVLPADYKEQLEKRRKNLERWKTESDWTPRREAVGRKLNIANLKFGPSVKKPKLVLRRIDPVKEKKRVKTNAYAKRYAAEKRKRMQGEALLQQQIFLQQQRANMINPKTQGTPIIKDGKIVGYAVKVDDNATKLPIKIINNREFIDGFPVLDDYSLLEPEVILEVKDEVINLRDSVLGATGTRQVMVNGKLLTLVPYAGKPPPAVSTVVPDASLPRIVSTHSVGRRVTVMKRPDNANEEVTCDKCFIRLPKRLIPMHMKMRHSEKTKEDEETTEIDLDDEDEKGDDKVVQVRMSAPSTSKRPLPALIELNPIEPDENQDPLSDPLAI